MMDFGSMLEYMVSVDVDRLTRTIVGGKQTIASVAVVRRFSCLMESQKIKSLVTPDGWMDRTGYVMTWITNSGIREGDIVTYNSTRHVIKIVTYDVQGQYFVATLEAEAK